MDTPHLAALVLGGVAAGTGILLIVIAFFIREVVRHRPGTTVEQTGPWDVVVEIAKRLNVIYLPGLALLVLGVILVLASLT